MGSVFFFVLGLPVMILLSPIILLLPLIFPGAYDVSAGEMYKELFTVTLPGIPGMFAEIFANLSDLFSFSWWAEWLKGFWPF